MRLALLTAVALTGSGTAAARAEPQPLWAGEVRLGGGVSLSSAQGQMGMRRSPLTIAATAAIAVHDVPPLAVVGGLYLETLDRTAAGATAALRLTPGAHMRLAIGATLLVAPYSLYGATGSVGACQRASAGLAFCGDLEITTFIAGSDLAEDHAVTQVQLIGAVRFDAP